MGASRIITGFSGFPNINLGSSVILSNIFSGGGSVCLFARPISSVGFFFQKDDGWSALYETSTQRISFAKYFSGTHYNDRANLTLLNKWGYYSFVYNSDSTSNRVKFYYNGNLLTNSLQSAPTGSSSNDSANDLIFANSITGFSPIIGGFGHAQIWDRELNQPEILESMYKPGSIRNGLVGFWPCMGDSPERDLSGNGNDGVVTGTTISNDGPQISRFL